MIKNLVIKQRAAAKVLTSVVFTPPSLDLDPGEAGTVTAAGVDQFGAAMPVTVQSVSVPVGFVVSKNGAVFTIVAPAVGPAADQDITAQVDVA